MLKRTFIITTLILAGCASSQTAKANPEKFEPASAEVAAYTQVDDSGLKTWVTGFKQRAAQKGISAKTLSALDNLFVNEKVVKLDRSQPEHKQTMEQYLANVINDARIKKGKQLMRENKKLLTELSSAFQVEPEYIVALWGLETSYGKNTGGFGVVNSLATLAYEGRRKEFFENELINALKIIDAGHVSAANMRGSWAGAMGQNQFMPSSFNAYAIDYNNDGKKDIWATREDVLASIANYLFTEGWSPAKKDKEKTLMHWNRSKYFVASVFKLAEEIKHEE